MAKTVKTAARTAAKTAAKAARAARPAQRPSFTPPVAMRAHGLTLAEAQREYIVRRFAYKLDKHQSHIEGVSVRLEDVNGPRGGTDLVCKLKVALRGLEGVLVEEADHDLKAAIDRAAERAERAVRRTVQAVTTRRRHEGRGTRAGRKIA